MFHDQIYKLTHYSKEEADEKKTDFKPKSTVESCPTV